MIRNRTYPDEFYAPVGKPDYIEFLPTDGLDANLRQISGVSDEWLQCGNQSMHPDHVAKIGRLTKK